MGKVGRPKSVAVNVRYHAVDQGTAAPVQVSQDTQTTIVFIVEAAGYDQVVRGDGATAHWRLGEPDGDIAHDVIGGSHGRYRHRVRLGLPGAVAGDTAVGLEPSGAIELPSAAAPGAGGPATVEWWARTDPDGHPNNPSFDGRIEIRAGNDWSVRSDRDGHLVFRQGPFRLATRAVVGDRWRHVALIWDGANIEWFIDGQPDTSAPAPPPRPSSGEGPIEVRGRRSAIDEFAIYAGALPADRLTAHAQHRDTHTSALAAAADSYWPADDPPGATIADRNGANHGQVIGAAQFGLPGPLPGGQAIGVDTGDTVTLPVPASPAATYQWWLRPEQAFSAEQTLAQIGDLQVTLRPDARVQLTDRQHHRPRLLTRGRVEPDQWALIGLVVDHDTVTVYLNGHPDTTTRLKPGIPSQLVLHGGPTAVAVSTLAYWATALGPDDVAGLWALR